MPIDIHHSSSRAFGTFPLKGEDLLNAVLLALEAGYRAFDTAQMYDNEADLGNILKSCGIAREDLFITTKVHPDNYGEKDFIPSVKTSLEKLQTDRVDLLLLHWPPAQATDEKIISVIGLLDQARDQGLSERVGVSNFNCHMMKLARRHSQAELFCNQVEFHPLLNQFKLLECARQLDIPLSAFCSSAKGKVVHNNGLIEIGAAHNKSPAQVALRWVLQHGVGLNTMSTKKDNINANFNIMDFELSSYDMARIDDISRQGNYRIVHSGITPWAPEWD